MEWPERKADGSYKTTETAQKIWQASNGNTVSFTGNNFRKEYKDFVVQSIKAQSQDPITLARAGLECAMESFQFRSSEDPSKIYSLEEAFFQTESWPRLESDVRRGQGQENRTFRLASHELNPSDGSVLWFESSEEAVAQLQAYVDYGAAEPSILKARSVLESQDVSSTYIKDKAFCLLGLTSELGPAKLLLDLSDSFVMGICRQGPKLKALQDHVESSSSPSSSTLVIPRGGADLLCEGPQIARWIVEAAPKDRTLVILPLAYMDGEANVRATMAMDCIIQYVVKYRHDVELVYYTSPATAYPIPFEAALDAKERYERQSRSFSFSRLVNWTSLGLAMRPSKVWEQLESTTDESQVIFNGIASLQGPNYCLAKTLQQWRCLVAHADGKKVVAPHAPPSRTWSVQHNASAAAGLEGMQHFPPLISFDVAPCSSLLAAVVLQLLSESRHEYPNIYQIFWEGSVHGGSWRLPYELDSCMVLSYLLGQQSILPAPTEWKVRPTTAPR